MRNRFLRSYLETANQALGNANLPRLPDFNRMVGEYELKEVKNIKPADIIVQFGNAIRVKNVTPPKRFSLFPSKRKNYIISVQGIGEIQQLKFPGNVKFRVLKNPESYVAD